MGCILLVGLLGSSLADDQVRLYDLSHSVSVVADSPGSVRCLLSMRPRAFLTGKLCLCNE